MVHVEGRVRGRQAPVANTNNRMKVVERWTFLFRTGMRESLFVLVLLESTALAICVDLGKLALASVSVSSLHPDSAGVFALTRSWVPFPHVLALARLMMSQPFAPGLQDVSLSSCLLIR